MYSLAEELGSDDEDGIYWLKEASDRYHFNASYKLGNYYFHKRDDHDSALTYFLKASSQGYGASSPYHCGYIYYFDRHSYSYAANYFKKAADTGDGSNEYYLSCYYLATCYENGRGVSRSDWNAMTYYGYAMDKYDKAEEGYWRMRRKVYGY